MPVPDIDYDLVRGIIRRDTDHMVTVAEEFMAPKTPEGHARAAVEANAITEVNRCLTAALEEEGDLLLRSMLAMINNADDEDVLKRALVDMFYRGFITGQAVLSGNEGIRG